MEEEKQEKVTHSYETEQELSDCEIIDEEELLKCSQNEEMPSLEDGELDYSEWDLFLSKGEEINQVMGRNECEDPYPLSEEEEIMLAALVDYESNCTQIFKVVRLNL